MTETRGVQLPPCPFCGKALSYSIDTSGMPDGLIHGLPTCKTFDDLDPMEFVTAARNKMQTDRNIS